MRWGHYALVGILALALGHSAQAQQQADPKTILTGIEPSSATFKKVDVSGMASPSSPVPSSIQSPSMLSRFFSQLNPFSSTPTRRSRSMSQTTYKNVFTPTQPTTMTIDR